MLSNRITTIETQLPSARILATPMLYAMFILLFDTVISFCLPSQWRKYQLEDIALISGTKR
jgi:hypothetical protein